MSTKKPTKSPTKRMKVAQTALRVRAYDVLQRAVEEGVAYGWNRSYKHTDTPSPDIVKEQITTAVMSAISEYFEFDSER